MSDDSQLDALNGVDAVVRETEHWLKLEAVHFCKTNKVKYRVHLTAGMMAATFCGFIGLHFGVEWMNYVSLGMNALTAVIWIWK